MADPSLSTATLPTNVKYAVLERTGNLPQAPAGQKMSKNAAKKAAKAAKKASKKQKGQQQLATRNPPVLNSLEDGQFGDLKCIQSRWKTGRVLVNMAELTPAKAGQKVWARGRVHTTRAKGKNCFMVLRRGLCSVQACMFASDTIPKEMVQYAGKLPSESIVDVFGTVSEVGKPTNTTQSLVELQVERIYAVSVAMRATPFKLQDAMTPEAQHLTDEEHAARSEEDSKQGIIRVSRELRLNNRTLDMRTPANHAIFRLQSAVGQYFRQYFLDRDFTEIHTPKITPGVSEGGASVFRLKYFGRDACLAQSPQLYKQMASVCGDLFKVFEVGPVFRAEDSNTHRHMCEFVGLDFEMEIVEHYHEVLKVLGDMFVYVFDCLNKYNKPELAAVNGQYSFEPLQYGKDTLVLHFRECVRMLREAGENMGDYDDFTTPQEKKLGKLVKAKYNTDFYIVDQYPLNARPFYTMPSAEDPNYSNSYDVFLRGEEITSGAQRVHEIPLLLERATACEIPHDNIQGYVDSFALGAPPHGGAGIGLERVVMLFMGLNNIRKTSMFPRTPARCTP